MIGLVGLIGGAALEIRRVARRGRNEVGAEQAAELRKAVEQYAKDLEQERRVAAAAARKADELQTTAAGLAAQNAELLLANTSLSEASARLEEEKTALVLANHRLAQQMEQVSVAHEDEAARFAADMAALRDKVAEVLQRMFSNTIDEPAAVEALRDLGCAVRFVPGARRMGGPATSGTSLEFKPQLLLEDTAKIARLMQAARTHSGGATPRLLESSGMASGLSPRAAPQPQPRMALTIGGGGGGSCGSRSGGSPSFVLSWLGSTPGPAGSGGGKSSSSHSNSSSSPAPSSAGVVTAAPQAGLLVTPDAVKGGAKRKDAAPAAALAPSTVGRNAPSPSKAARAVVHVQEQDGNLVFAPAQKAKGGKSRMGLSLSDATGMLKLGGSGGGGGGGGGCIGGGVLAPGAQGQLPGGALIGSSDTSSSSDLVLSKRT